MKKTLWIISALVAIITAVAIQFMPDKIPAHYNLSGEIDRFGSKYELLIYPVIIFIMNIFWVVIIKNFEKKALNATDEKISAQYSSNIKVVSITAVVVTLFQTALHIFSIVKAYNISQSGVEYLEIDSMKITCFLIGMMFIVCGNFLPKTKNNGTIGLRISWSMYNDTTWNKSNRFAGIALMISGVVTMISCAFIGGAGIIILMLMYLTVVVVASSVYAHKIYNEELAKTNK